MIKSGTSKRKGNELDKKVKREKLSRRARLDHIREVEAIIDTKFEETNEDDD